MPAALRTGQKAFIAALCSSFNEETLYSSEESAVTAASTLLLPPLFGRDAAGSLSELSLGCSGRRLFADWSYLKKGSQTGAFQDGSATYSDFSAVELPRRIDLNPPNAAVCDARCVKKDRQME